MFLNNRYHDPTVGAFISVDPLVAKTGTPYLYASGNPTTLSDPSGLDPGWAHDLDPCNDAGYYECGTAKGGPNRGKKTTVQGFGPRALREIDRGAAVRPEQWCYFSGSALTGGSCGAPPETGEYERSSQVKAVLDYLSKYGGYVGDGAAGGAQGATVSVAGYTTARGTTVLSYTRYRAGLADFGNGIAPAGKLTVGTRWVGRAFVALQSGVTAFDSWQATEGHTTLYRLSYTTVKTVVTTGGAIAGAGTGASWGATGGAAVGGPVGAAVGGAVGAAVGGIFGWWAADEITDLVWNYTYEQVAG